MTVCVSGCDFTSIQKAVDSVGEGYSVDLGVGVFRESVIVERALRIRGLTPAESVIEGEDSSGVMVRLTGRSILRSVTVRGGVVISGDSQLVDSVVRGGVGIDDHGQLVGSVVEATDGGYGAAVDVSDGAPVIDSSTVIGGIMVADAACLYVDNSTVTGGAVGIARLGEGPQGDGLCHTDALDECNLYCCDPGCGEPSDDTTGNLKTTSSEPQTCPVIVYHSTIAFNDVGLVGSYYYCWEEPEWRPQIWLFSSLVASNTSDCEPGAWGDDFVDGGFNLSTDQSCGFGEVLQDTEPILLELSDNGGPTPTHALAPASPAIDAGGDNCLPKDQRGVIRP